MKKLCFGTIFNLLCQIKNGGVNQNYLYKAFVTPTDKYDDYEPDKGSVGNRKKGIDDIPNTEKDYFISADIAEIASLYRTVLYKKIKQSPYRECFVLAIQQILQEDTSIADSDEIGSLEYTKEAIINNEKFDFSILLVNLMRYCANINNNGFESQVAEIDKSYIESFRDKAKSIFLFDEDLSTPTATPLKISIDEQGFKNTFVEINQNAYSLGLPNPHKVKIFKLRVVGKEFNKDGISDFILNNISQYVYSRTKIKSIESNANIRSISTRAIRQMEKTPAFANQTNTFCEIMLYSFLECSMHAPKIMSGFEVSEAGRSNKYSSGIYLLPAGVVSSNNQVVFGCTKAHDNLHDAIDDVFAQASNIRTNRSDEVRLLDPSVLDSILEPQTANHLKNIIMPSKSSDVESDDAFGLFLSYSVNVPNKDVMSNNDYRTALNLPADNLFITSFKNGRHNLDTVSFRNLIGRVGRIDHSMFGNVFMVCLKTSESTTVKKYEELLTKEIPTQKLSLEASLTEAQKRAIIVGLVNNDFELSTKPDTTFDEFSMMRKAALIFVNDLRKEKQSRIVKLLKKYASDEEMKIIQENIPSLPVIKSIDVSPDQYINLHDFVANGAQYPSLNVDGEVDYDDVVAFLEKLANIFKWHIYEKKTLGYHSKENLKLTHIRWYANILYRWMSGHGLSYIIQESIKYKERYPETGIWANNWKIEDYYNRFNPKHKNLVIADTLNTIENVILFSVANYFREFSAEYKKQHGNTPFHNDWYEYVEYGTTNPLTILLQRYGYSREASSYIISHKDDFVDYAITTPTAPFVLNYSKLFSCNDDSTKSETPNIYINVPELFI